MVPKDLPADIDFVATTIGSSTSCRDVTSLCDFEYPDVVKTNSSGSDADHELAPTYDCKRERAGLDLVGNMSTSITNANHGPVLVHYTDSTMTTTAGDIDLRGPTLWYAVLPYIRSPIYQDGILACSTELSDVVRCPLAHTLFSMLTCEYVGILVHEWLIYC